MNKIFKKIRRKNKIRQIVSGDALRPRVSVYRSNSYIYLQAINDALGVTIASANSLKSTEPQMAQSEKVAKELSDKLQKLGIKQIVFDRNGLKYHGIVKAIADELRKNKLEF